MAAYIGSTTLKKYFRGIYKMTFLKWFSTTINEEFGVLHQEAKNEIINLLVYYRVQID